MGFFSNVWTGATDIAGGVGGFVTDVAKAGTELGQGHASDAASTLFTSVQDDLMGQVLQGAFGPDGIIGSVVGLIPETARKPGRAIITPTMEAWKWTIDEVVDRPLGTIATVVNATIANGAHELFDLGTYVDAYKINDARTFGQAFASALYNINPFDTEEYNSISDDPLFNLISGTADFAQEFLDPVMYASAGIVGAARGTLIVGGVSRRGAAIERATRVMGGGAGIRPVSVLGKSRGVLTKNAAQIDSMGTQIAKYSAIRGEAFLQSTKWASISDAMDVATAAGRGFEGRLAELNGRLGKSGAQLPRRAKVGLASGETQAARELTFRAMTGDSNALRIASETANDLHTTITVDMLDRVDEYQGLLAQHVAGELTDPTQITRMETLAPEIRAVVDKAGSVDWSSMYDMRRVFERSQQRGVIPAEFGYDVNPMLDLTLNSGDDLALFWLHLDEIVGKAGKEGSVGLAGIGTDLLDKSSLAQPLAGALGEKLPYGRGMNRLREKSRAYMDRTGNNAMVHEYVNPNTFAGGRNTVRIFFEKLPQSRVDFHDVANRYTMFERELTAASRVKVGGERLIDATEVGETLARFAAHETSGDFAAMMDVYDATTKRLIKKFDDTSPSSFASLVDQYSHTQDVWKAANERARVLGVTKQQPTAMSEAGAVAGDIPVHLTDETIVFGALKDEAKIVSEGGVITDTAVGATFSPSQQHTTRIATRWDLVERELTKYERRAGASGAGKILSDTIDAGADARYAVGTGATALMKIWRPAVLLTPKWPMRVGLDEQLRIASDLGGIETLRMFGRSIPDLSRTLAAKSIARKGRSLDAAGDITHIVNAFDDLLAKHGVKAVEDAAGEVTVWSRLQALETKLGAKEYEKQTRDLIRNLNQKVMDDSRRYRAAVAGVKGLAVGVVTSGPVGLIYSGVSFAARRRRLMQVTELRAGVALGDALIGEGRRLLGEAFHDPLIASQAESMIRRGEDISKYVKDATKSALPAEAAGILDRADQYLADAGVPMLHVGQTRVRGAFGDDLRHIGKIQSQTSSTNSMNHLYKGARADNAAQIAGFAKQDWKAWDMLEVTSQKARGENFSTMMNLYTSAGEHPQFYRTVWGPGSVEVRAEELSRLLRKDGVLRREMGFNRASDSQIRQIADDIITEYDNVLPQNGMFEHLRAAEASGREVKWSEVNKVLDKEGQKIGVSADEMIGQLRADGHEAFGKAISPDVASPNPGNGTVGLRKWMDDKLQSAFDTLGSSVSDNMARNPYFAAKYEKEINRRMVRYIDQVGEANVSQAAINLLEGEARGAALKEIRTLLYDLAEDTRFGEIMANIMPFYNAWGEVISRWSGMAVANPYYVANVARLYSAPWNAETLGITEVSDVESGAKFLMFRWHNPTQATPGNETRTVFDVMSPAVRDLLIPKVMRDPQRTIRMSKDGLASMMQQTTPSFGPLVTIPVREAILANPSLEQTFGFMFPYGHPEGGFLDRVIKDSAPTWMKSVDDAVRDSPTNERMVQSMFVDYAVQRQQAGDPIDAGDLADVNAAIKIANDRAEQFHLFRIATGLFSPVSTTALSPYAPLMKIARDLQHKWGTKEGNARFLAEYGTDFFTLTARMTQLNDGVGASVGSEKAYMANTALVQAHPEVGAWITGSLGSTNEVFQFSQAAYRRQRNQAVSPSDSRQRRERKTPMETIAGPAREQGWAAYGALSDAVREEQGKRQAAGLPYNLNASSMQAIAQYKREQIKMLKVKYPEWAQQFDDYGASTRRMKGIVDGFMAGLQNEGMLSLSSTKHVIEYFQLRQAVQDALTERQKAGGSANLDASRNDDLRAYFDEQKAELGDRPEFSRIYDRYFARDSLAEATFADPGQFTLGFVRL